MSGPSTEEKGNAKEKQNLPPKSPLKGGSNDPTSPGLDTSSDISLLNTSEGGTTTLKPTLQNFELLTMVGNGFVGKVFQVRMKNSNKIYAMKVIRKGLVVDQVLADSTKTEKTILAHVDHPFIAKLHYSFQTDKKLYLIMDYLPGGDLTFHLQNVGRFDEVRTRFYAAEIVLALEYLHEKKIMYRDLKSANTLLDTDGHVRLVDFGLSKKLEDKDHSGNAAYCGTMRYMAPEILKGDQYGNKVDCWSLGILIYQMLTGQFPFDNANEDILKDMILWEQLSFPDYVTAPARSLISKLLNRNPKTRYDITAVKSEQFFASVNWDSFLKMETPPPFKPYLEDGIEDYGYFPSELTDNTPTDSYVESGGVFPFDEFTYISPSATNDLLRLRRESIVEAVQELEATDELIEMNLGLNSPEWDQEFEDKLEDDLFSMSL